MPSEKPSFSIPTMTNNFRRFNARIGAVFTFQARAARLLSWRRPTHTLSFLAVYTFVCLDPHLLTLLPPALLILGVLVPSFVARHPAAPAAREVPDYYYSPHGPALAPARTVKPAKELSRDFFRNMRDLQNSMEDFSVAHDSVVGAVVPLTNFSNEAVSSALFLGLAATGLAGSIAAQLLPWRLLALTAGWGAVCSGHPRLGEVLSAVRKTYIRPREEQARSLARAWVARDVLLDEAPETREVEIFELQRRQTDTNEWEPWLFSPAPHDPLSRGRERARGTRFFEDVLAPEGWEWSEKKWALDLWSREWVEERIITGVEVETEGERWVYDIASAGDAAAAAEVATGEATQQQQKSAKGGLKPSLLPSWEEAEEGDGRRGEWRRRRWVRLVKRKKVKKAKEVVA
jgi:hypothetical protein